MKITKTYYKVMLFSICILVAGVIYTQMDYIDTAPPDALNQEQSTVVD